MLVNGLKRKPGVTIVPHLLRSCMKDLKRQLIAFSTYFNLKVKVILLKNTAGNVVRRLKSNEILS